jgi:hypothetical protein
MASAGHAWAQAETTSPSRTARRSRLAVILAFWMRWMQYEHFSITPRMRTDTFGFAAIFSVSGTPPW